LNRVRLALLLCALALPAGAQTEVGELGPDPAVAGDAPLIADLDVPVMPGLAEADDQHVAFDQADGRIIQATLAGSGEPAAALDYYARAMSALGWRINRRSATMLALRRDSEQLSVRTETGPDGLTVRFDLRPAPATK